MATRSMPLAMVSTPNTTTTIDMNRRSFILGGGLIGVLGAAAQAVAKAARPEKAMVGCKDHHEPADNYHEQPAIAIGHQGDTTRSLVPCKKCGALFALTIEKKEVKLFNPVSGKTESVVGLGLLTSKT